MALLAMRFGFERAADRTSHCRHRRVCARSQTYDAKVQGHHSGGRGRFQTPTDTEHLSTKWRCAYSCSRTALSRGFGGGVGREPPYKGSKRF
jgi:hypothetical protein